MRADAVTTCLLCFRADETASMVHVEIPHAFASAPRSYDLCRDCSWAIARACRKTGELPPIVEVIDA